jgi:hypothetical protein
LNDGKPAYMSVALVEVAPEGEGIHEEGRLTLELSTRLEVGTLAKFSASETLRGVLRQADIDHFAEQVNKQTTGSMILEFQKTEEEPSAYESLYPEPRQQYRSLWADWKYSQCERALSTIGLFIRLRPRTDDDTRRFAAGNTSYEACTCCDIDSGPRPARECQTHWSQLQNHQQLAEISAGHSTTRRSGSHVGQGTFHGGGAAELSMGYVGHPATGIFEVPAQLILPSMGDIRGPSGPGGSYQPHESQVMSPSAGPYGTGCAPPPASTSFSQVGNIELQPYQIFGEPFLHEGQVGSWATGTGTYLSHPLPAQSFIHQGSGTVQIPWTPDAAHQDYGNPASQSTGLDPWAMSGFPVQQMLSRSGTGSFQRNSVAPDYPLQYFHPGGPMVGGLDTAGLRALPSPLNDKTTRLPQSVATMHSAAVGPTSTATAGRGHRQRRPRSAYESRRPLGQHNHEHSLLVRHEMLEPPPRQSQQTRWVRGLIDLLSLERA